MTGDQFLVAPASNRAKIFDRDGHELYASLVSRFGSDLISRNRCEFQKGDMYLVDLINTKCVHGSSCNSDTHDVTVGVTWAL
jgi:hypothetical protein